MSRTIKLYTLALIPLLLCSGCSSKSAPTPEDEAKEIGLTPAGAPTGDKDDLFRTAKRQYGTGMFNLARDSFETIKTNHPVSPYAEFAEIKLADSHFEANQFETAGQLYEQFTKDRPASSAAPYALMRTARSAELAYGGLGRDIAPLERALQFYDRVIAQYPNTVQAESARSYRQGILEKLRDHEELVAAFYTKFGKSAAADARREVVTTRWEPMVAEAESVNRARAERASIQTSSLLPASVPISALRPSVYEVARGSGAGRILAKDGERSVPRASQRTYEIQRVECRVDGSARRIILHLNRPFDNPQFLAARDLPSTPAGLQVTVPDAAARNPGPTDCFGAADLTLGADGSVKLPTERSAASIVALRTPPRLILVLR